MALAHNLIVGSVAHEIYFSSLCTPDSHLLLHFFPNNGFIFFIHCWFATLIKFIMSIMLINLFVLCFFERLCKPSCLWILRLLVFSICTLAIWKVYFWCHCLLLVEGIQLICLTVNLFKVFNGCQLVLALLCILVAHTGLCMFKWFIDLPY